MRILTDPNSEQLIDLLFELHRRQYRTSHGVGLLRLSVTGLEGTYAVALTGPGDLQQI
jgi:hypothetical protein